MSERAAKHAAEVSEARFVAATLAFRVPGGVRFAEHRVAPVLFGAAMLLKLLFGGKLRKHTNASRSVR